MSAARRTATVALALGLTTFVFAPGGCQKEPSSATAPTEVRSIAGFRVLTGVADGYIEDTACRDCHADLYDSYQDVGMARSFYPPSKDKLVEPLDEAFVHAATGRIYEMSWRDGKLFQKRYRTDRSGRRFAEYEAEVAWIVGSGNHVRSYISHNEYGEMFQLPLSWYAESGWGMSPGYDRKTHFGFERRISRHCMFCHNAYPEIPKGGDAQHKLPRFPRQLPHGIGCQRCHGPGAAHVRAATADDPDEERIRSSIENPKNFAPAERERLCLTCHLQPETLSDSQMLPRRFGQPFYGHGPRDDIAAIVTFLDHGTPQERGVRQQINHHGYRLRQSRCFTQSGGELTCLTCHDPHKVVPKTERSAFYAGKCRTCHTQAHAQDAELRSGDCVACHMPKMRPEDVVHARVTDHNIRRRPPQSDATAPRPENHDRTPPRRVQPYFPTDTGDPKWQVLAGFATAPVASEADLRAWTTAFARTKPHPPDAYVELGQALGRRHRHVAINILREGVREHPNVAEVQWALGDELWLHGQVDESLVHLEKAAALDAEHPGISRSLAIVYGLKDRFPDARRAFERAIAKRPNDRTTWLQYANTLLVLQALPEAAQAYERAIALVPDHVDAYRGLAGVYGRLGRSKDARRVLEQGASFLPLIELDLIALLCLAPAAADRDVSAATHLAAAAIRKRPSDPRAALYHALTLAFGNDPAAAARAVERARALRADPASCAAVAAIGANRSGEKAKAQDLVQRFERGLGTRSDEPLRAPLRRYLLRR